MIQWWWESRQRNKGEKFSNTLIFLNTMWVHSVYWILIPVHLYCVPWEEKQYYINRCLCSAHSQEPGFVLSLISCSQGSVCSCRKHPWWWLPQDSLILHSGWIGSEARAALKTCLSLIWAVGSPPWHWSWTYLTPNSAFRGAAYLINCINFFFLGCYSVVILQVSGPRIGGGLWDNS